MSHVGIYGHCRDFNCIANKTCYSKKLDVAPINVWFLQEQKPSIHNIMAYGTDTLDGYNIKAFNQNLDGEN